ncbi:MAG: cell wall-binding repeat-containing protein [Catenulisporales bacterium]|nr:cell wall-binding repeat-containing protein [Catenulisporales bacterium]
MRSFVRKSLAASAVLASSVAATAGIGAGAHAAPAGPGNSPLTLDLGPFAPDGSRYVYADSDGAIITHNSPGGAPLVADPAKPGVARSHPTFFADGSAIVFSQTVNGVSKLVAVPAFTPEGDPVQETDPLSKLSPQPMPEGTESSPDSNGRTLAFQHRAAGHDEIWVQDAFGRGSEGPIRVTDDGTSPSVSPDGKTIAFLRQDGGGHEQIWTVPWNGQTAQPQAGTPVQVTNDARDHLNPTFTPDGSRITYEGRAKTSGAPDNTESVAATGGSPRQEWPTAGVPNYQPLNRDTITRLAGDDRIGTAIAASQAQWPSPPGNPAAGHYPAYSVVLSRSDQFADALGGSTLAQTMGGPLLLTPTDRLDAGVKAEITRVLGPADTHKTVYVLGGEQALSPTVYNAVKKLGYTVERIAGADRYATSIAIAKQITGPNQPLRILVATGDNAPDALSAGAAAESFGSGGPGGVVVLSNDKVMPSSTAAYVKDALAGQEKPQVYGIGGQGDAALNSIGVKHTALVGSDRYQTSYLVAKTFFGGWEDNGTPPAAVGFATGLTWPDALSGGAFMGQHRGPLLLVDPVNGISPDTQLWLAGWAPYATDAYIFGGLKAVNQFAQDNYASLIAGQRAGYTTRNNPKA